MAALPGVTDVDVINPNLMYAVTGGEPVIPTRAAINPNPFDVQALPGGRALVADAGANALLIVEPDGTIDWIATLPSELVSTANVKVLFGCPLGPPPICGWRIDPAARNVHCSAATPECSVVASGFTSIIDVAFDRRGTMYVTELDEASWFAVEVTGNPIGGASDATGRVYVNNHALEPGVAEVLTIK